MGTPDQEGLRGGPPKLPSVITDPAQVLKILRYLIKTGKPPPGLDTASLN
jgi:hypothetical protein